MWVSLAGGFARSTASAASSSWCTYTVTVCGVAQSSSVNARLAGATSATAWALLDTATVTSADGCLSRLIA